MLFNANQDRPGTSAVPRVRAIITSTRLLRLKRSSLAFMIYEALVVSQRCLSGEFILSDREPRKECLQATAEEQIL